jgi:hypothetical protein
MVLYFKKDIMKEEDRRKIDEIIGQFNCPKNFKCAASGFDNLCKAKDIGVDTHLLCLDKAPALCRFSLKADLEYLCSCPLRIYLAKHLKK